ncbi:FecR family protein [Novosphingobium sp. CF614]|uniref:FecR family protein n=1 Tax=Novosphingobium sp. CF614 TaxID=1884364 RepID=UPI0008EB8F8F|nr:FecR family protein [Novosphingobium sp. CF614]SFG29477.1 FecR family protein [Novosphingobium sp. CF614]
MILRKQRFSKRGFAPDEAASYWLVRLDSGPLDPREQAEFEAWHAGSPINSPAFERAQEAWNLFESAEGDSHSKALRESALEVGPESRRGIWLGAGAGIAASLLAAAAFNIDLLLPSPKEAADVAVASAPVAMEALKPSQGEFATGRGGRRAIDLADGSVLTLNTDSAVRVAYAPGRRFVRLLRGQVLFEVARDRRRPFVVQAADRQVTALGTVFEVMLDRDRMKVTLVEGKVVVDAASDRPANAAIIKPMVLAPGQEFVAAIGSAPQLAHVDVDQQLRWREGFVEFDDVPLAAAVREMNRYSSRQLIVHDDVIGNLRISGVFRTGNPQRFGAIVGELLPVRSRPLPDDNIELSMVGEPAR